MGFDHFSHISSVEVFDILAGNNNGTAFLRTRFMAFLMYSMAVILVKNRYSSSINAAVFPLDSRASDIKERTLNSMAFRIAVSASVMSFVPKQINRLLVMLVCPLKNLLSAPMHMDFSFKHKSLTVSLV